jgi:hypothetical protein
MLSAVCDISVAMAHTTQQAQLMPEHLSIRLPDGTTERGERLAALMAELPEYQGFPVSRSRVLTQALLRGLDLLEQEHGVSQQPKGKGRK